MTTNTFWNTNRTEDMECHW